MSAVPDAERVEDSERAAQEDGSAAPLDLVLGDATGSPLRRFLPGMSGVRFSARLARHPGRVAARGGHLAAELTRISVGRSRLAPHEKDRRFAEEGWSHNIALRRTLQTYLALGESAARPRRGRRARLGRRPADPLHRRQPRRGRRPEQPPVPEPQGPQADHRHRWRQPPRGQPSLRARLRDPTPGAVHGGAGRVRGGRRPRRHAGCGGAAHRRVRADPVHPADRQGPDRAAADRPADDQQVLRHRPRRAAQPRRAPRRQRSAGVLHLLAQPGRPARRLGRRHLRRGDRRRRWRPAARSPGRTRSRCSRSARAACSPRWCWGTWPRPATSAGWPRSASRSPSWTRTAPASPARCCPRRRRPPPPGARRRRDTSTAASWRRSSPGCVPTT